ncbi:hypothetical protein [Halocola ammonii]
MAILRKMTVLGLLLSCFFLGQTQSLTSVQKEFLREEIVGDTVYIKKRKSGPSKVTLTELKEALENPFISPKAKDLKPLLDSLLIANANEMKEQCTFNNSFAWKELENHGFTVVKDKQSLSRVSFSLPIVLDPSHMIVVRSWGYSSSFAGEDADIWRLENGKWKIVCSINFWHT